MGKVDRGVFQKLACKLVLKIRESMLSMDVHTVFRYLQVIQQLCRSESVMLRASGDFVKTFATLDLSDVGPHAKSHSEQENMDTLVNKLCECRRLQDEIFGLRAL